MKRILAGFVVAVLTMSSSAMAISKDSTLDHRDVNTGSYVQAFDDTDIENNFQNYATTTVNVPLRVIAKTLNIAASTPQIIEENTADVVGLVYDKQTQKPIFDATVYVKGMGIEATTDNNGRFAIGNMPIGQYDLLISASGYIDSEYLSMPVENGAGTEIYSLAIDKNCAVQESYLAAKTMNDSCMDDCNPPVEDNHDTIGIEPDIIVEPRLYSAPNLMHLIVKYYHLDDTYEFHSFGSSNIDEYLYYVIPSEMYFYNVNLTKAQQIEAYKAQAVAARTYADYQMRYPKANHEDAGAYLCSKTHCQVYCPYITNTTAIEAVKATSRKILFDNIGNYRLPTEFHGQCNGSTTFNGVTMSCTNHVLPQIPYAHNRGMCQSGAVGKALQGKKYTDILSFYYPTTSSKAAALVTAGGVPTEGINPGEKKRISGTASVEYIFTVGKSASYYFLASGTSTSAVNASITVKNETGTVVGTGTNTLTKQLSVGRYSVIVTNKSSGYLNAFFDIRCPGADAEVFSYSANSYKNYMQGCVYKQVKFVPETTKNYTFTTSKFITDQNLYMAILDSNSSIVSESTNTVGYPTLSYNMTQGNTYYIIICSREFLNTATMVSATNFDAALKIT